METNGERPLVLPSSSFSSGHCICALGTTLRHSCLDYGSGGYGFLWPPPDYQSVRLSSSHIPHSCCSCSCCCWLVMFSCFFLGEEEGEEDLLLVPSSCRLSFTSLGLKTHGEAVLSFTDSKRPGRATAANGGGVLYLPVLLSSPSPHYGVRSKLSLTSSRISWADGEEQELTPLREKERTREATLPSYPEIRGRVEKIITRYGSSQSPDDVLLYIQDVMNLRTVTLQWISRVTPSIRPGDPSPLVQWFYAGLLPAGRMSLRVVMDVPPNARVKSVSSTGSYSKITSKTINDSSIIVNVTAEPETTNGHADACMDTDTPTNSDDCVALVVSLSPHETVLAHSSTLLLSRPLTIDDCTACDGIQSCDALFLPPSPTHINEFPRAEFIFMVDCSGSMSGAKIQNTSQSLVLAIKSLPSSCYFNVIAFGSKFRILFQSSSSLPVTHRNVEQGVNFANQLRACLGGTELLSPIQWVLKKSPPTHNEDSIRHFFLITDGGVPNVQTILQLATRHKLHTR